MPQRRRNGELAPRRDSRAARRLAALRLQHCQAGRNEHVTAGNAQPRNAPWRAMTAAAAAATGASGGAWAWACMAPTTRCMRARALCSSESAVQRGQPSCGTVPAVGRRRWATPRQSSPSPPSVPPHAPPVPAPVPPPPLQPPARPPLGQPPATLAAPRPPPAQPQPWRRRRGRLAAPRRRPAALPARWCAALRSAPPPLAPPPPARQPQGPAVAARASACPAPARR